MLKKKSKFILTSQDLVEAPYKKRQSIIQKNYAIGGIMRVKKVEYIKEFQLKITFGDNAVKIVDLENMIKKSSGIFLPLKDTVYFKQVTVDDCQLSICWPNGADICPDVLYEMGTDLPKKKNTQTKPLPKRRKVTSPKLLK